MPLVGGTEQLDEGLAIEVPRNFDRNSFVLLGARKNRQIISANSAPYIKPLGITVIT